MPKIFQTLLIAFSVILLVFGLSMDAQAKRFGGGKSFGMARTTNAYSRKANTFSNYSKPLNNQMRPTLRSFLGPIAGFVMGGLLASLFMGHGFGTGMFSWLIVLIAGYFIWQLLRNKFQPQQPVTSPLQYPPNNHSRIFDHENNYAAAAAADVSPSYHTENVNEFDEDNFLRQAKALFIRLQAAYDTKNLTDLRAFTTPEVYAEIQLQLHERGEEKNVTEVVSLQAELLGTETIMREMIASVRFSGSIKEDINQPANSFVEIWHFKQALLDGYTESKASSFNESNLSWRVAGISQ